MTVTIVRLLYCRGDIELEENLQPWEIRDLHRFWSEFFSMAIPLDEQGAEDFGHPEGVYFRSRVLMAYRYQYVP